MKKLYDEGLIDPANFTQNAEALSQQCRSEVPTVGGYTSDHVGMGIDFNNTEINAMYHALHQLRVQMELDISHADPYLNFGFNFAIFDTCDIQKLLV